MTIISGQQSGQNKAAFERRALYHFPIGLCKCYVLYVQLDKRREYKNRLVLFESGESFK